MRRIEAGLVKVHSLAGKGGEESATSQVTASGNLQDDDELPLEPFLRVNLVSSGSPAELAVIYLNTFF